MNRTSVSAETWLPSISIHYKRVDRVENEFVFPCHVHYFENTTAIIIYSYIQWFNENRFLFLNFNRPNRRIWGQIKNDNVIRNFQSLRLFISTVFFFFLFLFLYSLVKSLTYFFFFQTRLWFVRGQNSIFNCSQRARHVIKRVTFTHNRGVFFFSFLRSPYNLYRTSII